MLSASDGQGVESTLSSPSRKEQHARPIIATLCNSIATTEAWGKLVAVNGSNQRTIAEQLSSGVNMGASVIISRMGKQTHAFWMACHLMDTWGIWSITMLRKTRIGTKGASSGGCSRSIAHWAARGPNAVEDLII